MPLLKSADVIRLHSSAGAATLLEWPLWKEECGCPSFCPYVQGIHEDTCKPESGGCTGKTKETAQHVAGSTAETAEHAKEKLSEAAQKGKGKAANASRPVQVCPSAPQSPLPIGWAAS